MSDDKSAWFGFALVKKIKTIYIVTVIDGPYKKALKHAKRAARKDKINYDSIACFDLLKPIPLVAEAMCRWLESCGLERAEAEKQVRGIGGTIAQELKKRL